MSRCSVVLTFEQALSAPTDLLDADTAIVDRIGHLPAVHGHVLPLGIVQVASDILTAKSISAIQIVRMFITVLFPQRGDVKNFYTQSINLLIIIAFSLY